MTTQLVDFLIKKHGNEPEIISYFDEETICSISITQTELNSMTDATTSGEIRCSIEGGDPKQGEIYKKPFKLTETCTVKAVVVMNGEEIYFSQDFVKGSKQQESVEYTLPLSEEVYGKWVKGNTVRGRVCLYFADICLVNFCETRERQVLLVQTAVGGTGFNGKHWDAGDVLSEKMYRMVDAALALHSENRIVAFLWHQGEYDVNHGTSPENMEQNLAVLLRNIEDKYACNFPKIAGDFTPDFISEKGEIAVKIGKSIRKVFCEFDGYFVSTEKLQSNRQVVKENGEIVHFARGSLQELGKRYWDKFQICLQRF